MEHIIEPTPDFNFDKVTCSPPTNIGGSYFTKLFFNNKPLYIQTPKSLTKQGIILGKKTNYTDLLFNAEDTLFIQWFEDLEEKCRGLIFDNSSKWFESSLDKGDIENAFNSSIKIFRSGKNYLIRSTLKNNVRIYDENNNDIAQSTLQNTDYIISILEIQGIKFTAINFQILVEMKQAMKVSPDPFLDECFIKTPFKTKTPSISNNKLMPNSVAEVEDFDVESTFEEKEIADKKNLDSLEEINTIKEENIKEEVKLEVAEKVAESQTLDHNNIGITINELPVEFDIDMPDSNEKITLKKPNQEYYDLYKTAREKAKKAKKEALMAYLEAQQIKNTHIIDLDAEDSESDIEYNLEILE